MGEILKLTPSLSLPLRPSVSITGKREFEGRSSRSRTKKVKLEEGEDEVKQEVKEELQEGLSNSSNGKKGKSKVKVENQEDIKVKLEEKVSSN